MGDTKTIIDLQYEYRVKIEQPLEFRSSLFKKAYASAFQKLSDTLKHRVTNDFDVYNNIICFTGERGRGKTSTMISFKDALTKSANKGDLTNYLNEIPGIDVDEIINKKYLSLSVIDPTIFRGKETLIEIILAQMFSEFKCKIEKPDESVSYENSNLRKDIIKSFQDVFHHLKYLNSDRINNFDEDSIDALLNLASSTNLRSAFQKLTKKYLEFFKNSNYLVICLDDIDLKIEHNYLMLEDIRQTLNSNNIIILTTFKYEQLFESINNHFKNQLFAIKDSILNDDRTQFYLNKIFPLSRRVEIGEMNTLFEEIQHIVIKNDKVIIFENLNYNYDKRTGSSYISDKKSYENIVRQILFKNIGIILPKKEYRTNSLLPKTVRELIAFFKFSNDRESNLEYFSNYLLTLVNSNENKILQKIKASPKEHFKVTFINIIKEIIDIESLSSKYFDKSKLQLILDANNDTCISIGDIASLFIILDNSSIGKHNNLFVDVLELYYYVQSQIKDVNYEIPEIYNGVVKLNSTENGWIVFNNKMPFNFQSRILLHYLGKFEIRKKYREELSSPFNESINSNTRFAVFTPLSLIGNISLKFIGRNLMSELSMFDEFIDHMDLNHKNYLCDPIFLKQFILNFKKSNPKISSIKKRINFDENDSYITNDYLKMYYQTTYEVVEMFRLTQNDLGIQDEIESREVIFEKFTLEIFKNTLPFLSGRNSVLEEIFSIKERITHMLHDKERKLSFIERKKQYEKLLKEIELLMIGNNFDNGKLLIEFKRRFNIEISSEEALQNFGDYLLIILDDFVEYIENE